jgi:hypothetical protein
MTTDNISCPVCGYYCLGKGGHGCIDKPFLTRKQRDSERDIARPTYEQLERTAKMALETCRFISHLSAESFSPWSDGIKMAREAVDAARKDGLL